MTKCHYEIDMITYKEGASKFSLIKQ